MDASVEFLLQNLKELVLYHYSLISNAKNDLEQLNNDLEFLRAALKDASRKPTVKEAFKVWEKQTREVVYDVEDTIDTFITYTAAEEAKKPKLCLKLLLKKSHVDLAKEVRVLRNGRIKSLLEKGTFLNQSTAEPDKTVAETMVIRQKKKQNINIVGFDGEANTVINFLNKESNKLESITVVGMPGLGKTTLARKICQDQRIKYEFRDTIWVEISDNLNMKDVLLTILEKFDDHQRDESVERLTQIVKTHLESRKFLIVLDDIWTPNAWDDIKNFLPMNNKWGRVLITSRNKDVATRADPTREPHNLRFLTPKESWELLQYEVYDNLKEVPQQLVKVGKDIAKDCKGLPLSIAVIGGILKDKMSSARRSIPSIKKEWDKISKRVEDYLHSSDKNNLLKNFISLSYTKLPYELINCFLYLGMFPEDTDIPVKKLIRLWIAEGFIQDIRGKSLEQIAHDNLKDFINRNLLMVKEAKPNGEAKVCQVHDTIREFCKTEAAVNNLNLFQEIRKSDRGVFEPSDESLKKCRRLCIHSSILDFFLEKLVVPKAVPKARSFLCFQKDPINLDDNHIKLVTGCFAWLRVYDAETIKFTKPPEKFFQLIHLRYLTLVVANDRWNILPVIISELWNLQTLIVDISSRTLEIQADIWKLRHLRYLKTKASIILKNLNGKGEGGKNLHTLSRLSPESCTEEVFKKAKNLITLGIQGELSKQLVESTCLQELKNLNKLKLVHQVPHGEASEKPMPSLPEHNRFPPNLKILVLIGTFLDWNQLSVLEGLTHLEELKLKENACKGNARKGDSWEVVDGFKSLELLHIEMSDLTHWSVTGDAFPSLRFLLIKYCEKLVDFPTVLGKNLELLSVERVTQKVVSFAQDIKKQKEASNGGVFKLDIAAADEVRYRLQE